MEEFKLNTIEEAIADFREGKFLIVVDDEDRENEGDFIIAAEKITPENVNFMLKEGRGVLCVPITMQRCAELDLPKQVGNNTSILGTPFTVTVDKLEGCSTGVSINDRAATIRALADPTSTPSTFGRPGHINPLYAQDKGVLKRAGHTEAAVDLARLAGLQPCGALIEIMNEDGTMARLGELGSFQKKYGLKAYFPLARGFDYSHYDDFGVSRSYGYKRKHLGHDMMGALGTPIVAVEGGVVEAMGWNRYGGWRIGIRSFDGKRYYYYAHLRKNHPYTDMYEGKIVDAGEVIGYLGMTGYSRKENTNNIETVHLHFGMQLIFDESQKECNSEIWIDVYDIVRLLNLHRSSVVKTKDGYKRLYNYRDLDLPEFVK